MIELKKEYKVIIWGLGSVGRSALQIINEKKSLKLVAAYDVDPKKVGRDAGEVCGFSPAGVIVSNDREQVLNTDADICLYYAASMWDKGKLPDFETCSANVNDIVDLLNHQKNVTTTVNIYFSEKNQPDYFKKIDQSQRRHLYAAGYFPGLLYTLSADRFRSVDAENQQTDRLRGPG